MAAFSTSGFNSVFGARRALQDICRVDAFGGPLRLSEPREPPHCSDDGAALSGWELDGVKRTKSYDEV